jgi:hypothetical protein
VILIILDFLAETDWRASWFKRFLSVSGLLVLVGKIGVRQLFLRPGPFPRFSGGLTTWGSKLYHTSIPRCPYRAVFDLCSSRVANGSAGRKDKINVSMTMMNQAIPQR